MTQIIKRIDLILSLRRILGNNNSKKEMTQETKALLSNQSVKEEEALLSMK